MSNTQAHERLKVQVFSDYVWPWCYVSTGRIAKLEQEHNVEIEWIHFPLHPETPEEGASLEALFADRGIDVEAVRLNMQAVMEEEGLPYGHRTHTYNSRLSQELGKWAETQPGGEAIHDAMFKAYFVDCLNVSDIDVLVDIAASIGLSPEDARKVLTERSYSAAVDHDWQVSIASGVTGVPTFAAGGYGVVGAQPYETLVALVEHARANPQ